MRPACLLALESKRLFSCPIAFSSSFAEARSHRFTWVRVHGSAISQIKLLFAIGRSCFYSFDGGCMPSVSARTRAVWWVAVVHLCLGSAAYSRCVVGVLLILPHNRSNNALEMM